MRHLKLAIGDLFKMKGQYCRKTSAIGFTILDEAILGEIQFSPDNDKTVEYLTPEPPPVPAPAPVKKAAPKKAVSKGTSKKKSAPKKKVAKKKARR